MSSIKTTQIDGDVSVGRNVSLGGKARIAGSAIIGHNLKVEGWLDAPNIKNTNKGLFTALEKLETAFPTPKDGWFAGVGTSTPFDAYVAENGEWVATGGTIDVNVDFWQNAIKGYRVIESTDELPEYPTDEQQELGYILADESTLYVYVGERGDTLGGKYKSVDMKGPKGNPGTPLGETEIVNDLESDDPEKVLSANQGRVLKGMIDSKTIDVVNDLTTGGEDSALSAEMGKVLNEKIGSSDDVVVKGFSEYIGKLERKIVDDLSALSARWPEPNGAPKDAYFDRPCTITSVTFKTIKISNIDPSKIVTFKAWNKEAGTVRVLGQLESSALNTVETFIVSWEMNAGEYLLVDGNISCIPPSGTDFNTYKVTYNSETGVVTGISTAYKHKLGLHYTFTTEYSNVPSLVHLKENVESPAFFEGNRNFIIHQVGAVSSTGGKDNRQQFSKDAKVNRDCILWSVKVNKSTNDTTKIYAFNLSTMKRRTLAEYTPTFTGIHEIIVNQPVYKDEYVASTYVPVSSVSNAAYEYTVDENDNILTLSSGGRTEASLYTFLLPYSPLDVLNRSMYGTMVNQGSSIAVFGGSFSIYGTRWMNPIYDRILQPKVKTHYGVGGCGFINGTTPVPTQIDNAIASGVMYDLWILWASTNDCGQPVGSPTDAAGTTSQAAAMRLCINKIYAYNPYAKIVVFGSARAFSQSKFNEQNGQLHQLVQGQKDFCEYWDIPYLDQWSGLGISSLNYARYFNSDSLHWNDRGYELACYRQAQFLMNLV